MRANPNQATPQDSRQIKAAVADEIKKYDVDGNEHVQSVRHKLKLKLAGRSRDDDDELEEVDQGYTENSFKCGYTQKRFVKPMKNTNCLHRLDEESFKAMIKKDASAKCPTPGCSKLWTKGSASHDEDFQYEMERFFRTKSNTQPEERANTISIDEDEEYTRL